MKKLIFYIKKLSFPLLYSIIILFLFACKPKQNYSFTTIDSTKIENFLISTNKIRTMLYNDVTAEDYFMPTKDWVVNVFMPDYKKFVFYNNLSQQYEGSNDCDKLVTYALAQANLLFFKQTPDKSKTLAVGQYTYFLNLQRHVILFFVISDEFGNKSLLFYDPTLMQVVDIDKDTLEHYGTSFII